MRVGIIPIASNAPFYAADKLGYFTAENLAVSAEVIRGGAAAIPAMVNGATDVLFTNSTSAVAAIVNGIDLRFILEGSIAPNKPPDSGALVKRRGDPYRSGKDLEGKVIAVNTLRDVVWMIVRAWISNTGGDPAKVQMVEVPIPSVLEALRQKRVDAALVIDPSLTLALSDPAFELLGWPMSGAFAGGPMSFFVTTGDVVAKRPNDLRAFIRAYKRGAVWANANEGKEPYYRLVADFTKLDINLLRRMAPVVAQAEVIPNSLLRLTAVMQQTGLLDTNLDVRGKIFT